MVIFSGLPFFLPLVCRNLEKVAWGLTKRALYPIKERTFKGYLVGIVFTFIHRKYLELVIPSRGSNSCYK